MSLRNNLYPRDTNKNYILDVYDMPVPSDLNFVGSELSNVYPPETGIGVPNPEDPLPKPYQPIYPQPDPGDNPGHGGDDPGTNPDPGENPDNPNPDNPDPGTGGDDPNNPGNDDPDDPNHGTIDPNNPDPGNDDPDPGENPNDDPDPDDTTVYCDVKFIPQAVYFESDNTIPGAELVGTNNIDNGPFYYLSDSTTYVYLSGEERAYGLGRPGIAVSIKSTDDVRYFKVYINGTDTGTFLEANPLVDDGRASVAWDLTGNIFAVSASALTVEYNVSIVEVDMYANEVQGGLSQTFYVSLTQNTDTSDAQRTCFVPIAGTADAHRLWAGTCQWHQFE